MIGNLNPAIRDAPDYAHKLWDHLFIMSQFKLEVESPYPIPTAESFVGLPDEVAYPKKSRRFRHYGSIVKTMIAHALTQEVSEERDALVFGIAAGLTSTVNGEQRCQLKVVITYPSRASSP